MRAWILILLIPLGAAAQPLPAHLDEALVRDSLWGDGSLLQFDEHDEAAGDIRLLLDSSRATVETFFGAPFRDPLTVTLVPGREAFSGVVREAVVLFGDADLGIRTAALLDA